MTEPLIDRDMLRGVIRTFCGDCEKQTDAALAYLREVLTPEALAHIYGPVYEYRENGAITVSAIGAGLHRRIFGEGE